MLPDHPTVGIAVLHLALGAITVGLTAVAAAGWGVSGRRAAVAAWIVALDPVLAWQGRSVMTETLSAALVAATLASLILARWRGAFLGGTVLGLAGLCRPSLLPAAVLTLLAGFIVSPGDRRERLLRGLSMAVAILAVMAPWAARNARIFGAPVWTTTHGGYTLALANNEVYYRDVLLGPPGRVWTGHDQWLWWDSVNRKTSGMTELEADRFLRNEVIKLAFERPVTFLAASIDRLARFWSVAPAPAVYPRIARWATAAWTIPLWIALVLGMSRPRLWSWPQISAPLQLAGLSLVHSLYWTDLRMRAPIVPAIALIAATAVWPRRNWLDRTRRGKAQEAVASTEYQGTQETAALS
jgi:hypothetical protein